MNYWENTVITSKGLALLAKLIDGNSLHITKCEAGEGYVTPGTLQNQTVVTDAIQTLNIREVIYKGDGRCELPCFLTNDKLSVGYTANQIGVYAADPDEGEILFFISQAERGKGTPIPSSTEMPGYTAEWGFFLEYGQADSVTVVVDPAGTVSRAEMEEYIDREIQSITNEEIDSVFPEEET